MKAGALLLAALGVCAVAPAADAIPAFARRYNLTCMSCHDPVPKLNAFGEQFLARGYRLADDDTAGVTTLGDPLLWLQQNLPLAVRMDAYLRSSSGEHAGADFATPMVMKLLSGGAIAPRVSYYFYLLLAEEGVVGPVEDAWVMFRRPFGVPADITAGQFQIADPVWKRELRVPLEDYAILSLQLGDAAANLSYDRGVMVDAAPTATTGLTLEVVNGNGIGEASGGRFDNDAPKTAVLWARQQVGPLRLFGVGYYGGQRFQPTAAPRAELNTTWMVGPGAQVDLGSWQLGGQFVWRHDSDPTFDGAHPDAKTDGGFAEATFWPSGRGGRVVLTGLYNRISSDVPGNQYETGTVNASWLYRRNLRLAAEGTYDLLAKRFRGSVGFVTAF